MGLVKEPEGVDFIVGPSILTEKDRTSIRNAIATYKRDKRKKNQLQRGKVAIAVSSKSGYVATPTFIMVKADDSRYHRVVSQPLRVEEGVGFYKSAKRKNKRAR